MDANKTRSNLRNARVRANAILGLAYIAWTKRKLKKHIVKPEILRTLREEKDYEWRIIDAIEDINLFYGLENRNEGVKFANKKINKERNRLLPMYANSIFHDYVKSKEKIPIDLLTR